MDKSLCLSTVTVQHLNVLEKACLIITKKQERERWNYLDVSPIQQFHQRWIKPYAVPSAQLLPKLKTNLEAPERQTTDFF
jgi:hypothetical protein